jgi:hypothetical protein
MVLVVVLKNFEKKLIILIKNVTEIETKMQQTSKVLETWEKKSCEGLFKRKRKNYTFWSYWVWP